MFEERSGPKTWNSLPKDLRQTAPSYTLKRRLKPFLLKAESPGAIMGITKMVVLCRIAVLLSLCHFRVISLSFVLSYILTAAKFLKSYHVQIF